MFARNVISFWIFIVSIHIAALGPAHALSKNSGLQLHGDESLGYYPLCKTLIDNFKQSIEAQIYQNNGNDSIAGFPIKLSYNTNQLQPDASGASFVGDTVVYVWKKPNHPNSHATNNRFAAMSIKDIVQTTEDHFSTLVLSNTRSFFQALKHSAPKPYLQDCWAYVRSHVRGSIKHKAYMKTVGLISEETGTYATLEVAPTQRFYTRVAVPPLSNTNQHADYAVLTHTHQWKTASLLNPSSARLFHTEDEHQAIYTQIEFISDYTVHDTSYYGVFSADKPLYSLTTETGSYYVAPESAIDSALITSTKVLAHDNTE